MEIMGKLISGIVSVLIVFRYLGDRYKHTYESNWIYTMAGILCCILNIIVVRFNIPIINICFWIAAITLIGRLLYFDDYLSQRKFYLVNIVFILAVFACETIGVGLSNINQSLIEVPFFEDICGTQAAVVFYYLLLEKLFIRKKMEMTTARQYVIYTLVTILVLVNSGTIIFFLGQELIQGDYLFLVLSSVFALFIEVYLFHMLDAFAENTDLKHKNELYDRQAQSYYNYYIKQAESYNNPLSNYNYCNNQMLNVILNDKADFCKMHDIKFDALIYDIDIDFMETIDITTLFGNILDNAVDACSNAEKKGILLKIHPFNDITYVCLSNTFSGKVQLNSEGKLVPRKDERHRIGLENVERVVDKYNGDMKIETDNNIFTMHLMLNQI